MKFVKKNRGVSDENVLLSMSIPISDRVTVPHWRLQASRRPFKYGPGLKRLGERVDEIL